MQTIVGQVRAQELRPISFFTREPIFPIQRLVLFPNDPIVVSSILVLSFP